VLVVGGLGWVEFGVGLFGLTIFSQSLNVQNSICCFPSLIFRGYNMFTGEVLVVQEK